MSTNDLPNTRRVGQMRGVSVIVAVDGDDSALRECVATVRTRCDQSVSIVESARDAASVNLAIARMAPSDVIVLSGACLVGGDWIERLAGAAYSDTNIATVSALARSGSPLALGAGQDERLDDGEDFERLSESVASRSRMLRPRLSRAVGPCIYVRRDALELVGPLDEQIDLQSAIELDFAQRCVLAGLTHVAADDVVVEPIGSTPDRSALQPPSAVLETYPYLTKTPLADSAALGYALHAARGPSARLSVTLDARALDGSITGTHVHVLELIRALARTDALQLRLLIRADQIAPHTRRLLGDLPHTELLAAAEVGPATRRTAVFHRPQQTFSPSDVALALALGDRFVVSQLDLIAYRNPGYFDDAATWEDYRAASRHGLSAAERVVVFSEHTRAELLADALVDDERIRVVPPGLDHGPLGDATRPPALDQSISESAFLLCLGTDFRHKNRVFAMRLLAALRERHDWSGRLVLAGMHISPGSSAELERAYLDEHPELADAVVSLGPVDEGEKAWLLAHADAIVYPSAYEGFGLVPFESALSGVPCIFAPQASLAEAAPHGTATIVPWDPIASAAATYELLSDADARESHVQALRARAETFTWDAAAVAMVEVYRQAAAAPVRDSATLSRDLVKREARLSVQHEEEVARLVGEREHAQRMYDELNAEVGFGLSLIGPHGALPQSVQRALLALAARPAVSRPLFAGASGVFIVIRAIARPIAALLRRSD